jgi:hypothetical protein
MSGTPRGTTRPGPRAAMTPSDGAGVRLLPVPQSQPPYDDELDPRPRDPSTQGALALAYVLPGGLPAVPEPSAQLRLLADSRTAVPRDRALAHDDGLPALTARRPTPSAALPEPRRWTARLAQALAEALAGYRPVQQLLAWTDEEVYTTVTLRAITARQRARAPQFGRPLVRALRVSTPRDGVVEASAVVQVGRRCRALAFRLEGLDGRWRCTALEVI